MRPARHQGPRRAHRCRPLRASPERSVGAKWASAGWRAVPAHDDRQPSLSIRDGEDGKVLVHCHAGCDQRRVIASLRDRAPLGPQPGRAGFCASQNASSPSASATKANVKRSEAALAIWQSTKPASGTPVETYLASRGLLLPPPPTLRFHAGLKHPSGGIWPAMVALVTRGDDGTPLAIHRTFLARDGFGKAPVDPPKMMLGPCRGGAVRLGRSGRGADGRRRDRDLPRCHAGDGASGLGGALDLRAAHARSAATTYAT